MYLAINGHDDAEARPMHRRISNGIGESASDVRGISGWHLATSSRPTFRIGGDLDSAHAKAEDDQLVALVQRRKERPLGDSLVCMTLATFSQITAPQTS
ncbi:hypothetical protein ACFUPZ_07495 [Microbacterium oxydans]|uniref:hypothetical protein n=1 Tax=Microbacterium TaxID=33882 RepID=UPI0032EAFDD5